RHVVVTGGGIGVLLAEGLAADGQGLLEQGLSLAVLSLRVPVVPLAVVGCGCLIVLPCVRHATCPLCLFGAMLGAPVIASARHGIPVPLIRPRCVVLHRGGVRVLLAEVQASDDQDVLDLLRRLAVLPLSLFGVRQVVVAGGGFGVLLAEGLAADGQGLLAQG